MRCPDCKQEIGTSASCDCGWQRHGSGGAYKFESSCMAYGCPLSAGFNTEFHDNGTPKGGVCRFHHGADADSFQEITARLRSDEIRPLARAVIRMQKLSAVEIQSLPIREFGGIPETAPEEGETNFEWKLRMQNLLHKMVTDGLQKRGESSKTPEVAKHTFHAQMANIADQILVN